MRTEVQVEAQVIEVKELSAVCPICGETIYATIGGNAEPNIQTYSCEEFIEFDWNYDGRVWVGIFDDGNGE